MAIDKRPVVELATPAADPPAELAGDCGKPVDVPDDALSAGAVERLWAEDRAALENCREQHQGLARFYRDRDKGLAGK